MRATTWRLAAGAATAAALCSVALSGCNTDSPGRAAAGPSPTGLADPTPATTRASTADPAGTPDGTTYGYLRRVVTTARGADAVVYDKVDYLEGPCLALGRTSSAPTGRQADRVCFRNVNPVERTVELAPGAVLLERPAGDPPRTLGVADLAQFLRRVREDPPVPITAFRLEVAGGVVVRLEEFRVS
ncbi:MAG: hypothetical protein Q8R60_04215 [Mycobacteriales bacterium]|nr:hypothetical protein [Mycobacteriales bacterium]